MRHASLAALLGLVALAANGCSQTKGKTVTGYLEVAPFVYGKGSQPVTVHAPDQSHLLSMWFKPKYLKYANRRVVVTGNYREYNPGGQSFRYFDVHSIELANRQQSKLLAGVPSPPIVRSAADIDALHGAWGVAVGKVAYEMSPKNDREVKRVTLTLADGYTIDKPLWRMVAKAPEQGGQGSIVFKRERDSRTGGWLKKVWPREFCAGYVPRCGMR